MSDTKPVVATQFLREKRWVPTTRKEALKLISEEMPETDAEGTLTYILSRTDEGKYITLGECCFAPLFRQ